MTLSGSAPMAEVLALRALAWIAADDAHFTAFLEATGADRDMLATAASDPVFLGAVMDFLLADDHRVLAFCDATSTPYDRPMQARAGLPGGDLPHWT